jgi:hypothetical protein
MHHGWHGTHRYNIQVLATHTSTWVHWYSSLRGHVAVGMDLYSSEEYRCTHVDACVARTRIWYWCVPCHPLCTHHCGCTRVDTCVAWILYRCVLCHPWCTHRTSLVGPKKPSSAFLWLWTNPLRSARPHGNRGMYTVRPTIAIWPGRGCRHGSLQQWRISMHPFWCVCCKNLNIKSMCAVSPVVYTLNIFSCQNKLFQFSCGCEQFH